MTHHMKTYRSKHAVEAMRWTDTDANREAFAAWFEKHGTVFETRGAVVALPGLRRRADCDEENAVSEGEWIVWMDGDFPEFIAMTDKEFADTYEEAA